MYKDEAVKKIDKEMKEAKKLSNKGDAVKNAVVSMLKDFCGQEEEFAQAVCQSDKTVGDCIAYTVKDCLQAISDLEVYKRAAEFFFPGAKVHMALTLDLIGDAAAPAANSGQEPVQKNKLEFSFDDLF